VRRATLILADRPTARQALVALAGAVEASAVAERVQLVLARGPQAIATAVGEAETRGHAMVVGWSFFSAEADDAASNLRRVRQLTTASALHLAGGVHASAEPEGTLDLGFDLIARGEGEGTIIAVLSLILDGGDPRTVPGLVWRDDAGIRTSGRAAPACLDDHPGSSRRLGKALALEVTRGCAWACRFCQTPLLHRARWRHRSIASARAWARHAAALGHRDLRFLTPSALSYGGEGTEARVEEVDALLAAVREEVGPGRRLFYGTFPSELRPEHVTPAALRVMARRADNRRIHVGAQSGSERLLAAMHRGHGVEEVERAVRVAREAGFEVDVDFIAGVPGETDDDRQASRRLMSRLAGRGARVHAHAFLPLPGTPWRDEPPGEVDGETAALLDRLASLGRAHGQWRRQAAIARALAGRR
jgi:B12-binding domain/radical SAM domain protein